MDLIKEGLHISKGDYICLLDGDDYFYLDKLETLEKYLNINKNSIWNSVAIISYILYFVSKD